MFAFFSIGAGPERLFDQARCSLPHVTENLIVPQGRAAHLFEGGIHRESKVNSGVDERAIILHRPLQIKPRATELAQRRYLPSLNR